MRPRDLVLAWVEAFNRADADALAAFYAPDAVNHQVAEAPVQGREAIRRMFADGFAAVPMVCLVEQLFEDGDWAILEWRDPLGLRGCGFFQVLDGRIVFQRGYWDKLTFLRQHGLALPEMGFVAYPTEGVSVPGEACRLFAQAIYDIRILLAGHLGSDSPSDPSIRRAAHLAYAIHNQAEAALNGKQVDLERAYVALRAVDAMVQERR